MFFICLILSEESILLPSCTNLFLLQSGGFVYLLPCFIKSRNNGNILNTGGLLQWTCCFRWLAPCKPQTPWYKGLCLKFLLVAPSSSDSSLFNMVTLFNLLNQGQNISLLLLFLCLVLTFFFFLKGIGCILVHAKRAEKPSSRVSGADPD